MHHRPRPASAQAMTQTLPAAYDTRVTKNTSLASGLALPSERVRSGAYDGAVIKIPTPTRLATSTVFAAAEKVAK